MTVSALFSDWFLSMVNAGTNANPALIIVESFRVNKRSSASLTLDLKKDFFSLKSLTSRLLATISVTITPSFFKLKIASSFEGASKVPLTKAFDLRPFQTNFIMFQ